MQSSHGTAAEVSELLDFALTLMNDGEATCNSSILKTVELAGRSAIAKSMKGFLKPRNVSSALTGLLSKNSWLVVER